MEIQYFYCSTISIIEGATSSVDISKPQPLKCSVNGDKFTQHFRTIDWKEEKDSCKSSIISLLLRA